MSLNVKPVPLGSEHNVPSRLVIVPDIGPYFSGEPNWFEVTPTYLMNWTDFRQSKGAWCGLAIVAPELGAKQLFEQNTFQNAWKWWANDASQHQRSVHLAVKDESSGRTFEFGTERPAVTAQISVFTKEVFDEQRMPSSTITRLNAWEKILTTMMPGADTRLTPDGTIESWLDEGKVAVPISQRRHNPRHYDQVLVLRHGKIMPKTSLYRLKETGGVVAPHQ